jgi:putative membrane protein
MVTQQRAFKLTWGTYCLLRWIREAINNLLPVAQLGGVAVGTRMLARRGTQLPAGVAGAIVDTTLEFISQIVFTLMGLGLLFLCDGERDLGNLAVAGMVTTGVLGAGLLAAQWFGLAKILEWAIEKLGKAWGRTGPNGIAGLHEAIMELYRTPRRIAGGFLFHLAAWLLGAVEIYISLGALGHEAGIAGCVIIEAIGQALKSAGFVVPASLGVQEGGYVLAGTLFGVPPEAGIALSLIKRLRDVVLGLPALAAWHWLEGRPRAADIRSV